MKSAKPCLVVALAVQVVPCHERRDMNEDSCRAEALEILRRVRRHVRARTRTAEYHEHSDHFTQRLMRAPIGVGPEHCKSVGTDAAVIDFYYDVVATDAGGVAPTLLRRATQRLQEMADLARAARALPALGAALEQPSCSLLDVAGGLVAAMTILGHAALAERISVGVADQWLSLWQDYMGRQNRQFERNSGLCLLARAPSAARTAIMARLDISPGHLVPRSDTFSAGLREYLAAYAETSAFAPTLIGGLPFADGLSPEPLVRLLEFLRDTPGFLQSMSELFRFAPDIRFDASEPVNAGIFALAAERGVSVVEVDSRLVSGTELEARMRREWDVYLPACRRRVDEILAMLASDDATHRALADLTDAAFLIAERMPATPYKV